MKPDLIALCLLLASSMAWSAPNRTPCANLTANGEAEIDNGNITAARKILKEAVKVCDSANEKSARPYIAYGKALYEQRDYKEATLWFKRGLQDEPDLPLVYMNLSAAYFQLGDMDGAAESASQGVVYAEKHLDDYDAAAGWAGKSAFNAGLAYVNLSVQRNDFEYAKRAEPFFLKTAKYLPDFNQTYFQLGAIREGAYQDKQGAAKYYAKACELGYAQACGMGR